jgi:CRISPR/Cas system-associated exonuclease Cas4 (RecB family)
MSMTLSDLRGLPHTSVSQLKTFLQCPRKYRYQYIDHLEPAFRPIALAFGTAWHRTVGEYLLSLDKKPGTCREELQSVFRDSLSEQVTADHVTVLFDDDENLGETIDLGIRMLDVFLEQFPLPDHVYGVEVPFAIELVHPVSREVHPLPLVGAMDAVVEDADGPTVLEFKSGRRFSSEQLEYDLQVTGYKVAVREHGFEKALVKVVVTTKNKKPDVQIETVARHRRDEQELVEVALAVHRAIQAGVDYRVRSWMCRSCPYAGPCGS